MATEVVTYALESEQEDVIKYIATQPVFKFQEYASWAFQGNLIVEQENRDYWIGHFSVSVLRLLTDPSFGLKVRYSIAMRNAIRAQRLDIVEFLCESPEVCLEKLGGEYLQRALSAPCYPIFFCLLDFDEVYVSRDVVVQSFLGYGCSLEFRQALRDHPKTREYVLMD